MTILKSTRNALLVGLATACLAQMALTNEAVMKVMKAGLGEDIVISSIQTQPGSYSMAADDLIALKAAGVSDKIIAAMMAKAARNTPSTVLNSALVAALETGPEPEFRGTVYWLDRPNNKLVSLERQKENLAVKTKALGLGGGRPPKKSPGIDRLCDLHPIRGPTLLFRPHRMLIL